MTCVISEQGNYPYPLQNHREYLSQADNGIDKIMKTLISPCGTNGYRESQEKSIFLVHQCNFLAYIRAISLKYTYKCPTCFFPLLQLQGAFSFVPRTQWPDFWVFPSGFFWFTWRKSEQTPQLMAGHSMSVQSKHTFFCKNHLCFSWSNSSEDITLPMNRMSSINWPVIKVSWL